MSHTHNLLRAGLVLLAVFFSFPGHAAKTDVVTLINGNAITGEIKVLDFGALRYITDSMGTVSIDWEDIVSVTSNQNLQMVFGTGLNIVPWKVLYMPLLLLILQPLQRIFLQVVR